MNSRKTTLRILFAVFALLLVPYAFASQSGNFSVSATVSNAAPAITAVYSGFAFTPTEDATGSYQFFFNASDANGGTDLNASSATIIVNRNGQSATSTACAGNIAGNNVAYNCSVSLPYYYLPGTYSINASVKDSSNSYVENTSTTFTWNTLKAIQLTLAALSFSGGSGQADVAAAEGPQYVRNTGNYNFTALNVTGIELNSTTNVIGAGNFSVNVTNSANGQALVNNTALTVSGFSIAPGLSANSTLYFYLDIPASVPSATYTSRSNWVIDVN